jgi:mRNA-degrading endonuclease RelE of RelBE toxin-antitoxin system
MPMPYEIEFSREAGEHLRGLTARQQAMLRDALRTQLVHQPAVETRNRKPMQGENPIAPWELRVGDLRVYYDVSEGEDPTVRIRAVGVKLGNQVRIGREVINP